MTYFVDANIIIKAFTTNKDKEDCKDILRKQFITNSLCLVEAYDSICTIINDKNRATNYIKSLYKSDCKIIELDSNLLFESLKRVEKYNLNIFDLIHYTTALLNNCSEIVTYNHDFDNLEIKRIEP
ncbi:hypothetical protein CL617_05760 [archaeon]|nr:hypothetical protein [archaeon]|tara:strand:- start:4438 stop:4815 length:378 start_codon:yes stop_codon:yes gene_type:complete